MKPGDQLLMLYEIIRAVRPGESYEGSKLNNFRNNLFWAKPVGCDESYQMLICSDCMEMTPIPKGIVGANFSTVEAEDKAQAAKELAPLTP